MRNILAAMLFGILCFGCDKQININPEDPVQKSVVVSATRLATSAYLEKNGSEESVGYVLMLGDLMSELNDPALSTVEIQSELYDKFFTEVGEDLTPIERESIRALMDTAMALVYKYASDRVNIQQEYVDMLVLVGANINSVALLYEVSYE